MLTTLHLMLRDFRDNAFEGQRDDRRRRYDDRFDDRRDDRFDDRFPPSHTRAGMPTARGTD